MQSASGFTENTATIQEEKILAKILLWKIWVSWPEYLPRGGNYSKISVRDFWFFDFFFRFFDFFSIFLDFFPDFFWCTRFFRVIYPSETTWQAGVNKDFFLNWKWATRVFFFKLRILGDAQKRGLGKNFGQERRKSKHFVLHFSFTLIFLLLDHVMT